VTRHAPLPERDRPVQRCGTARTSRASRPAGPGRTAARRPAGLVTAAIVACALAGCGGPGPAHHGATGPSITSSLPVPLVPTVPSTSASGQSPSRTSQARQPTWMLTRSALSQMLASPSVRAGLERTRIYELLQPGQQPLSGVDAMPVVTFSAVAELRSALAGNTLPAGTGAVLYDPEVWQFTPAAEQRDPVKAAAQAAALAHAHGLRLIVSPALNLTTVLDPGSSAPRWQRFLNLGIARSIAKVSDVVELQAQSLERDTAQYQTFVREAAAQARAGNPKVIVLAGLSTNPPGAVVDSQQLSAAIEVSRSAVDGYWLNIPGKGPRCPTCNAPRPDIGIEVLSGVL
jgi:hypothetical protein